MKELRLPTQKEYPKEIHFGHEVYKIKFVKKFKHFGETDSEKKTIVLRDGLGPVQLLSTFIHELLHVIEFEKPLKIKHKHVYKLEQSLVEILLDNFL